MKPWQKWLLWTSSIAVGLTGVVYWWMDTALQPVDEWAVVNHPLQPWVLKAHIVLAPFLVLAIGAVMAEHIWKHFRNRVKSGRKSGVLGMLTLAPMILSGYFIQGVTQPTLLRVLVWLHIGTGLLYLLALGAHGPVIRRELRRRRYPGSLRRTPATHTPARHEHR